MLECADSVLFWLSENSSSLSSFNNNIEFSYWIVKNIDKVVYSRPNISEKNRYLDCLFEAEIGLKL